MQGAVAAGGGTDPAASALPGMTWIPAGTFAMGSDRHYPEEAPAHRVAVDGFFIDQTPVTVSFLVSPSPGHAFFKQPQFERLLSDNRLELSLIPSFFLK